MKKLLAIVLCSTMIWSGTVYSGDLKWYQNNKNQVCTDYKSQPLYNVEVICAYNLPALRGEVARKEDISSKLDLPASSSVKSILKQDIDEIKLNESTPFKFQKGKSYTFDQDGWAFTIQQEQQMRYHLVDADYLSKELVLEKQLTENYKNMYEAQIQISDKYKKAFEDSNTQLTETLKREGRSKFYHTLLGVALTVGAGLAIGFAAKAIK